VTALCLYDARQLSGRLLLEGGFECHATVLCRGALHKNPLFVEPETLQKELNVRRRDESKVRNWMG